MLLIFPLCYDPTLFLWHLHRFESYKYFCSILKFISNIILTDSGNELSTGKPVNFFFKTEAGEKKYRLQRPGPVTDRPQTLVKSLIPQNPSFCDF